MSLFMSHGITHHKQHVFFFFFSFFFDRSLCAVPQQQQLPAGIPRDSLRPCANSGPGQHGEAPGWYSCPRRGAVLHRAKSAGHADSYCIGESKPRQSWKESTEPNSIASEHSSSSSVVASFAAVVADLCPISCFHRGLLLEFSTRPRVSSYKSWEEALRQLTFTGEQWVRKLRLCSNRSVFLSSWTNSNLRWNEPVTRTCRFWVFLF